MGLQYAPPLVDENKIMSVEVPQLVGLNGTQYMNNLERYLRTATQHEVQESVAKKRHMEAQKEAQECLGAKTKQGLGQLKRVIPAREFHRWIQHHGDAGIWSDKQWLREWDRDNPQFKAS
tara:strand:- start:58 stop:417 length:360 start_codon:yes stop_codon:yes gene_type:complete